MAAEPATDAGKAVEEVVVTGSRVVTNGFAAPTPITTLSSEAMLQRAPTLIPDALNQLPQFRGSLSPQQSSTIQSNQPQQGNFLNLRNLGTNRVLILLDGVRVPPTSFTGGVDVDTLPQLLVDRVDVVTGGASAAYGSDAVAGVVNFILNKNFNGLKGTVQAGASSYGDAKSWRASLAGGRSLLDGKAHVEASFDHYSNDGIIDVQQRPQYAPDYFRAGAGTPSNPYTLVKGAVFGAMTSGGYITSGPAKGFRFLPNGSLTPFITGAVINNTYQIGGDGAQWGGGSLNAAIKTDQLFFRGSYNLTPDITFHAQMALAEIRDRTHMFENFQNPAITFSSCNAFLAASVQTQLGCTSPTSTATFTMARMDKDLPIMHLEQITDSAYINTGFDGHFMGWKWDATYVHGSSIFRDSNFNETYNQHMFAALDAVTNPANGQIVCRVTLTSPGSYPGCVPLNFFGNGAPSKDAINYVMGTSTYRIENYMDIGSFNAAGRPFSLWGREVSMAVGGEFRHQRLNQTGSGDVSAKPSYAGIRFVPLGVNTWNYTNDGNASGQVDVAEGSAEAAVPILSDKFLVRSLDFDGAVRVTHYSTSGTVETWKVNLTYRPTDEVRIRTTLSQDIAAPSLYQLFAGPAIRLANGSDPHTNTGFIYNETTLSNPKLQPEVGRMLTAGIVYTPHWLEGLSLSLDAYQLKLTGAIASQSGAQELNDCEASGGAAPVCALIPRPLPFSDRSPANVPTTIFLQTINVGKYFLEGADFEANYRTPVDRYFKGVPGNFEVRVLAAYLAHYRIAQSSKLPSIENMGSGVNMNLNGSIEEIYKVGPWSVRVAERFTGAGKVARTNAAPNNFYAGTVGDEPNRTYVDLGGSYFFGKNRRYEAFVSAQNIFNTQPPIVTGNVNPGLSNFTNKAIYDVVGTYVTTGVRFRY
jgi:outer membrane receptor protein involved in Fe transport